MNKKITMGLTVLALVAFAMPVFATPPAPATSSKNVGVNIEVPPKVSIWADNATVALKLGTGTSFAAASASGLNYIVNVAADITATVAGTLPETTVAGGGINFFIYPNQADPAAAITAMVSNAYNPTGAKVWKLSTLGTSQPFASVTPGFSSAKIPLVYAANAPGDLPAVGDFDLVVTYTITQKDN